MIYFVATPIGNLGDITFRAAEVLKKSDVIFCEDTRHSSVLLSYLGVSAPLKSYHKFNEASQCDYIIGLSREGKTVCVISDAGMPCISDPGTVLVNACKQVGEPYTLLPGACAAVSAFALSGFDTPFTFIGFLPVKKNDRDKLLSGVINSGTLLIYSAPHDVNDDLIYLAEQLGDRRVAVVKEISKLHERIEFFDLESAVVAEPKGEYVLVVEKQQNNSNALNTLSIEEHVAFYVSNGLSKMDAIKQTAKDMGMSKNDVYKLMI